MEDDPDMTGQGVPESLMPYDVWTEEAMRLVAVRALQHVSQNGLPGDHHIYLTFRTDHQGIEIPARLKTQYPQEMTIVLQHQFWDLQVRDGDNGGHVSIGLSFGGVPSTLVIPIPAVTAFADPHVRFGVRFRYAPASDAKEHGAVEEAGHQPPESEEAQVVSLDAFRRRTPPRDA